MDLAFHAIPTQEAPSARKFVSFDLRQPVNQWLGIALISIMCFWVVLFYFTHKTQAIAESYSGKISSRHTSLKAAQQNLERALQDTSTGAAQNPVSPNPDTKSL
jgi:hypothetical protein